MSGTPSPPPPVPVIEECASCLYFDGNHKIKSKASGVPLEYGACCIDAPLLSSLWIGKSRIGDAWVGIWPFVPRDAWCGRYVEDKKRAELSATTVEITSITFE